MARNRSWAAGEWVVVGAIAAVAVGLGYVGFAQVYEDDGYSATELFYRSLQLFVLESGFVDERQAPLALELARVLAPAIAAYAAIRALVILFAEQLALVGLRFRAVDHVVVAGLGAKGFSLAKAFRRDGARVVVVERSSDNPAIPGCRAREIAVVHGDANDDAVLLRAKVPTARHVIVTCGDDRTNIEVAFGAATLPFERRSSVPTAFVHVDDLALWRLLQPRVLALRERLAFRIEFFNVPEAAARMMLERFPPFDSDSPAGSQTHLLVVGGTPLAESVVLQSATMWRRSGQGGRDPLRITLAGPGAAALREALEARYPQLAFICMVENRELEDIRDEPPSAVFVCVDDDVAALATALRLYGHRPTRGAPTVLAIDDEDSGVAAAIRHDPAFAQMRLFGVLSRTLTPELVLRGTTEILARAKHDHYVECERERGVLPEDNPSIVPWDLLDESLKESNRLFADSVGKKLDDVGCAIVPAPLADPRSPAVSFSPDEVEELAKLEHDRWSSDLMREGWRWGPAKDPVRKLHPSLVPWDELSEDERDKDREPVRALPKMLARNGFELERVRGDDLALEISDLARVSR